MKRLVFLGLALVLTVLLVGCVSPEEKVEVAYLDLSTSSFSRGVVTTEGESVTIPYIFLRDYLVYEVVSSLAETLVLEESPSPPEGYQSEFKPRFEINGGEILNYKDGPKTTVHGPSYLFKVETTGWLEWSPSVWEPYCRYGYWVCKGETYARRFRLELPEVWIYTYFTEPKKEYAIREDYFQAKAWLGDPTNIRVDFEDPIFRSSERNMCPQLSRKLCQDP